MPEDWILSNSAVRTSTFSVQQIVLCVVRLIYLRTVNRASGTLRRSVRNHAARSTRSLQQHVLPPLQAKMIVVISLTLWWRHLLCGETTYFTVMSLFGDITYCVVTPLTLWWYHLLCVDANYLAVISLTLWQYHLLYGDVTYFVVISLTVWWYHLFSRHLLCGDSTYFVVTSLALLWCHSLCGDVT